MNNAILEHWRKYFGCVCQSSSNTTRNEEVDKTGSSKVQPQNDGTRGNIWINCQIYYERWLNHSYMDKIGVMDIVIEPWAVSPGKSRNDKSHKITLPWWRLRKENSPGKPNSQFRMHWSSESDSVSKSSSHHHFTRRDNAKWFEKSNWYAST